MDTDAVSLDCDACCHLLGLFCAPDAPFVTGEQKLIIIIFLFVGQAKILFFNAWVTEASVGLPARRTSSPTSTAELIRHAASSPTCGSALPV